MWLANAACWFKAATTGFFCAQEFPRLSGRAYATDEPYTQLHKPLFS
jgi:hypothetical protein